jgi:hypothetical protein
MRKNFVPKYRVYTNGENVVVAVSSYAGEKVRGVAKCAPEDGFDLEKGKKLAIARCALKIAKKRAKALDEIVNDGYARMDEATQNLLNMIDRANEANVAEAEAALALDNILKEL